MSERGTGREGPPRGTRLKEDVGLSKKKETNRKRSEGIIRQVGKKLEGGTYRQ